MVEHLAYHGLSTQSLLWTLSTTLVNHFTGRIPQDRSNEARQELLYDEGEVHRKLIEQSRSRTE